MIKWLFEIISSKIENYELEEVEIAERILQVFFDFGVVVLMLLRTSSVIFRLHYSDGSLKLLCHFF